MGSVDDELDNLVDRAELGGIQRVPVPESAGDGAEGEEAEDGGYWVTKTSENQDDPAQQAWRLVTDSVVSGGGLRGQAVEILRREMRPLTIGKRPRARWIGNRE